MIPSAPSPKQGTAGRHKYFTSTINRNNALATHLQKVPPTRHVVPVLVLLGPSRRTNCLRFAKPGEGRWERRVEDGLHLTWFRQGTVGVDLAVAAEPRVGEGKGVVGGSTKGEGFEGGE